MQHQSYKYTRRRGGAEQLGLRELLSPEEQQEPSTATVSKPRKPDGRMEEREHTKSTTETPKPPKTTHSPRPQTQPKYPAKSAQAQHYSARTPWHKSSQSSPTPVPPSRQSRYATWSTSAGGSSRSPRPGGYPGRRARATARGRRAPPSCGCCRRRLLPRGGRRRCRTHPTKFGPSGGRPGRRRRRGGSRRGIWRGGRGRTEPGPRWRRRRRRRGRRLARGRRVGSSRGLDLS